MVTMECGFKKKKALSRSPYMHELLHVVLHISLKGPPCGGV